MDSVLTILLTGVAIIAFVVVEAWAYYRLRAWVKANAPEQMPKFYLAAGALRLMAALTVLLAYCIAVRDPYLVKLFAAIFVPCYLASLVLSTLHCAKLEKQSDNKPKE